MDLGLRGKAAIVTGGSAGLGLAVAGELAREGCGVCICARNEERLASARREIQEASEGAVAAVRCDVERPEEIARVVEETVALFGTVHILVSNAGESLTRDFLDIRRADWERSMASVLYAAAVAFLAGERASYISGAALQVDGGEWGSI